MPIKVSCVCGKKLAVKYELAGKKVKCPACQKLLSIPKPKVQEESLDDEWDLGDSAEEDFEDESSDAPAKSRGAVSRKSSITGENRNTKSSKRGLLIGLSAGGGVLVVVLLTWLLWPAAKVADVAGKSNDSSTGTPSIPTPTTGGTQPAASTSEPRYASFAEFTDGMNETLLAGMVSEVHSVPWTMPGDVSFDETFPSKENTFVDGAAMFADGSIRHLRFRDSIHRPSCRALFTIAGKEPSPMSSLYPPGADLSDPKYPNPQEWVRYLEGNTQNKNSLKAIAVAFHNYHEVYKHLPPATVFATDGKPWLSWRVLILPFLGQKELYDKYDQSVPWNDPKNAAVLAQMPKVYRDPLSNDPQSTLTPYLVITGPGTAFPTGNAAREMPRPATSAANSAALAGNNPATSKATANPPASDVTGGVPSAQLPEDKFDHKAWQVAKPKLEAMNLFAGMSMRPRRGSEELFPDGVSTAVVVNLLSLRSGEIYPDETWLLLRSISHLSLTATQMGDARLKQLSEHPGIIALSFSQRQSISATGLAHLKRFPLLRGLGFMDVPLTPDMAKIIGELHELRVLNIDGTPVTGSMVESLLPLKNLIGLSLQNTGLTDAEAAQIAKLPKLQRLFLGQTKITDQGLQSLKSLSGLTMLSVRGLNVSPQAVDELQKTLPNCKILK